MRAGTSALTHYLLQHPHLIRNADGTEAITSATPSNRQRPLIEKWPAYVGGFPAQKHILTLDKTAQYLTGNLDALRTLLPSACVVAVLREPGQRAYSEFRHHCRAGRVVEVTAKKVGPLRAGTVLRGDALRGGRFASAALCYGARGRKKQLDELYSSAERRTPPGYLTGARTASSGAAPRGTSTASWRPRRPRASGRSSAQAAYADRSGPWAAP